MIKSANRMREAYAHQNLTGVLHFDKLEQACLEIENSKTISFDALMPDN